MCGIVGQFNFLGDKPVDRTVIIKMASFLAHRGPDDEGLYLGNNIGLGHRRLSIIDLSEAGHQPMFSSDKSLVIVYNGEIYNFLALKKDLEVKGYQFKSSADTEVILCLYKEYGADCLKYLRGMFSFAIWDIKKEELFCARDRLGKKPFLYYNDGKRFVFSSEMKSLLADSSIPRKINFKSIDTYLSLQYIPAPETIFQGIKKLPAAHYLIADKNGLRVKKYWDLDYREKLKLSDEEWANRIRAKLKEAVKLRLISDVPLGAFLSGGVDSSIIVSQMAEIIGKPIDTFTIGFDFEEFNEMPLASETARLNKTNHHPIKVTPDAIDILPKLVAHYGEPYADSSALPSYYVARETHKYVTVALNGDGGDENFLGYPWYKIQKIAHLYANFPLFIRQKMIKNILEKVYRDKSTFQRRLNIFLKTHSLPPDQRYPYYVTSSFFTNWEKENLYSESFKKELNGNNAYERLSYFYRQSLANHPLDKANYTDIHTYLPDDLLPKVDIALMMNGLEGRSPFLDHEFMELTARIPSHKKLRFLTSKYILKKAFKDKIPAPVLSGKKKGFMVPLDDWFRNNLREYAREILLDKLSLSRGYFARNQVENLLKEHFSGKIKHGSRIWALLFLELWHREFC
ncbi:MAG: asparagine synthase (glutamine-hydrolyzing) [Patescibacteria group bacterium]